MLINRLSWSGGIAQYLSDPATDLEEKSNLASKHPEIADRLTNKNQLSDLPRYMKRSETTCKPRSLISVSQAYGNGMRFARGSDSGVTRQKNYRKFLGSSIGKIQDLR